MLPPPTSLPAPSASTTGLVNIYPNDPHAKRIGLEQVPVPTRISRFDIPEWNGTGGLYEPGTKEFQGGQLFVVLNRTYAAWCDFFGAEFAWQPGVSRLPIVARAGIDYNAYYDREGLKFFYNVDNFAHETVYSCESSDIVAHECGHAVLDAHHPDYWDSLLAETIAFHEAFGDISAMLVTLQDRFVRTAILEETAGDLTKSNMVSRLAEQLANGVCDSGNPDAVVSSDALRDAVNPFQYRNPEKLPARAPASRLSSESHSFSRVFSGAFYDSLVGIYGQIRDANGKMAPQEALDQARSTAGHLMAQALVLAPRGEALFKTIASCMLTADQQNFSGTNFAALKKAFVARRILQDSEADDLNAARGTGRTHTSTLGGTASGSIGAATHLTVGSVRIGEEMPSSIRDRLDLPKEPFRLLMQRNKRDHSRLLHFAAPRDVQLEGEDLGIARGVVVTVSDAVAIQVDEGGRVVSLQHHGVDRGLEARVRDHVIKLVQRGRISATDRNDKIEIDALMERKQPYFVAADSNGNKRIRRAYIA